jgi:hypothetical protein
MLAFNGLPAELRYTILEHVIADATAPQPPPDIHTIEPTEWRRCVRPHYVPDTEAPAYLQCKQHPESWLLPYLLVSKSFQRDMQYVWTRYDGSTVYPVLSISVVGSDRDLPLMGMLLSWLTPRPTLSNVTRTEIRFRFHDQKSNEEGQSSLQRSFADAEPPYDITPVDILERALLRDWFDLQKYWPKNNGDIGIWVVKLSTEVEPDVRLASAPHYETQDPELKVIPHPYRYALSIKDLLYGYMEFLIFSYCEIWVDDTLVYSLVAREKLPNPTRRQTEATADVDCKEFKYPMAVDSLLLPQR